MEEVLECKQSYQELYLQISDRPIYLEIYTLEGPPLEDLHQLTNQLMASTDSRISTGCHEVLNYGVYPYSQLSAVLPTVWIMYSLIFYCCFE